MKFLRKKFENWRFWKSHKIWNKILVSKNGSKFWSSQTWQHFLTRAKHFDGECVSIFSTVASPMRTPSSDSTQRGFSSLDTDRDVETPILDEFAQYLNASIHPPNELSVPRCYPEAFGPPSPTRLSGKISQSSFYFSKEGGNITMCSITKELLFITFFLLKVWSWPGFFLSKLF